MGLHHNLFFFIILLCSNSYSKRLVLSGERNQSVLTISTEDDNVTSISAPNKLIIQGMDLLDRLNSARDTINALNQSTAAANRKVSTAQRHVLLMIKFALNSFTEPGKGDIRFTQTFVRPQLRAELQVACSLGSGFDSCAEISKIPITSLFSWAGGAFTQSTTVTNYWSVNYTTKHPNSTRILDFSSEVVLYTNDYACDVSLDIFSPAIGSEPSIQSDAAKTTACCNSQLIQDHNRILLEDSRINVAENTTLTYTIRYKSGAVCNWAMDTTILKLRLVVLEQVQIT
jgi:hypothetical protein